MDLITSTSRACLGLEALEDFVRRLAATPALWRPHIKDACDTRVFEQVWEDERVNAWLICWSEDHDTGFHDHDDSAAAITVISGHVREERLRLGSAPSGEVYGPGATATVSPDAIHRVLHAGTGPAVTLHAYSPPLLRTGAYRVGPAGELQREAVPYEEELRSEAAAA